MPLSDSSLNPQLYARARIASTIPSQGWRSELGQKHLRKGGLEYWQASLRSALELRLGGLSTWERVPPAPRILETRQMDGYRRETVVFATRPGLQASGYYLVPDNCPPGQPAVLCLPGHGRGVDSIVGIAEDGSQRPLNQPAEYARDYALTCVAHGYPTFALEQISFGHRRDALAVSQGPGASSCVRDSMAALMLGETMIGWRVWDAMRALDYLSTRPEADPSRLVTLGISGGGTIALFTAALDTRVACAVVSGYLCTFQDSILGVPHCVDNYAPGLLTLCEMPDVAALIAPRLLFAESGAKDPIFPLAGFENAVGQVREVYATADASDSFAFEVFDADHVFHGVEAFRFLSKKLPAKIGAESG